MTPAELTAIVEAAWRAETVANFPPPTAGQGPRDRVYASGFRDCTRAMALDLLHPEDATDFGEDGMERMLRGRERERSVSIRLVRAGERSNPPFRVANQEDRFVITDLGREIISGRIDGRLFFEHDRSLRPVFEIKSGQAVANVRTLEDLDAGKWTRHYADQLLLYCYAQGEPLGMLVLDQPGGVRLITLALEDHIERVQHRLDQARRAVAVRFDGAPLPDYHPSPSVCGRCPHNGRSCAPPILGTGMQIIDDPELEAALEERDASAEAAAAHAKADRRVKERLRGIPRAMCGAFVSEGHWQRRSVLELPEEIRRKYTTQRDEGAFVLEITRIEPREE